MVQRVLGGLHQAGRQMQLLLYLPDHPPTTCMHFVLSSNAAAHKNTQTQCDLGLKMD